MPLQTSDGSWYVVRLGTALVLCTFLCAWLGQLTLEISELRRAFLDEHRANMALREQVMLLRGEIHHPKGKTDDGAKKMEEPNMEKPKP